MSTAIVSEITGFSTHDGPGIRTTVFLKGCPLRCAWCSNPETWTKERMLFFHEKRCTGCGRCADACLHGAIKPPGAEARVDRARCKLCFECVSACLPRALAVSGEEWTIDDLFRRIERDKPFYGQNGGLTLSGGEPLSSPGFARELFERCKRAGISTVLDTTGYAPEETVEAILPFTDLVLLDLKHMDDAQHRRWTGVGNELILANAERIMATVPTRVSFPFVPEANGSDENVEATARFAAEKGVEWVDINPLHALGAAKYQGLGMASPFEDLRIPTLDEVAHVRDLMTKHGLQTTIGRMM